MDGNVLHPKLLSRLSSAADIVRSHDFIQIFSHCDADGLSSSGILGKTLLRAGKEFKITTITVLNESNMKIIRDCECDCILISDLGASYIRELEMLDKDVIVLDHHTVVDDSEKVCYVNPHLFGLDGMIDGCGATMSLLFSVQYDERNWDLVQVAFAGISGDKQNLKDLTGYNSYLLEEGLKRGFVTVSQGSMLPPGVISESLYISVDPYICGVTGNREGVKKLLSDARISEDKTFTDLTEDEKRRLSSMITVKLTQQGVMLRSIEDLCKTRYFLKDWGMDADSLGMIIDACGRLDLYSVGISLILGSKDDLDKGIELKSEYDRNILECMTELEKKGLTEMEHIQYFDSSKKGFTGMLSGTSMRYLGNPEKPVIGLNTSKEKVSVSSRGLFSQLDKGVNLADAMRRAAESVGGEGGGHKIASGASIEHGTEEQFLKNLDAIIGEQLNSAK